MSLLKELQERRTHVLEELNRVEDLRAELADFDRAIAALEPEAITDEQPELFDEPQEIEASSQSESCVPSLGAETDLQTSPGEAEESRDQFEEEAQLAAAIELTADVPPESDATAAINAMVDDMVGKLNLSPDAVGTQTYMDGETLVIREITADEYFAPEPIPQPEWNEPQTEGYAPVVDAPVTNPEAHIQAVEAERYAQPTNPEADFWSRGLAPSEPEKKHRFSIFGHKRETEEVS